eukprot:m51a1_g769 hypothetical protein (390) ;mRNA; r:572316-573485
MSEQHGQKRSRPHTKDERRKKAKYGGGGGGGCSASAGIAGTRGVLITCPTGRESQCKHEVMRLFGVFSDEHTDSTSPAPAAAAPEPPTASIAGELEAELAELRKPRRAKMFSSGETGVKGLVYIRVAEECALGPVELVRMAMESAEKPPCAALPALRTAVRMCPLQRCCQASPVDLASAASALVPAMCQELEAKTFKVEYRSRYNDAFRRGETIDAMAKCVPAGIRADLKNPDVIIGVQVFQRFCGLCVVRGDYEFNYRAVADARRQQQEGGNDSANDSPKDHDSEDSPSQAAQQPEQKESGAAQAAQAESPAPQAAAAGAERDSDAAAAPAGSPEKITAPSAQPVADSNPAMQTDDAPAAAAPQAEPKSEAQAEPPAPAAGALQAEAK